MRNRLRISGGLPNPDESLLGNAPSEGGTPSEEVARPAGGVPAMGITPHGGRRLSLNIQSCRSTRSITQVGDRTDAAAIVAETPTFSRKTAKILQNLQAW